MTELPMPPDAIQVFLLFWHLFAFSSCVKSLPPRGGRQGQHRPTPLAQSVWMSFPSRSRWGLGCCLGSQVATWMGVLQVLLPGCPGGVLHACHPPCILEWLSGLPFLLLLFFSKKKAKCSFNFFKFSGTASAHWSSMGRVLVDLLFPKNIQCWCGFYLSYALTETKIAFSTYKGALKLVFFHCNF